MKKTIVFKNLVDVLYYLQLIGIIIIVFLVPLGILKNSNFMINIEHWNSFHWIIFMISVVGKLILIRGLYFLQKMAKFLLTENYFSKKTIEYLKTSGKHFIISGMISLAILIILWINNLLNGLMQFTFDENLIIPLFVIMIGLFFIIQSNTLLLAKNFKDENDLTI